MTSSCASAFSDSVTVRQIRSSTPACSPVRTPRAIAGHSTSIARLIRDNSKARIIVSNPIKTKTIAQAKIKTDKIDARVLAELARVGYLPEVWLPDEDTEALRQFITDRVAYVRQRTECTRRTCRFHRALCLEIEAVAA